MYLATIMVFIFICIVEVLLLLTKTIKHVLINLNKTEIK